MTWRGSTTVRDRIFASLPYLLPLLYGTRFFGGSLLEMFPALRQLLLPLLLPVAVVYDLIPLAGLVVFFALLLLVVRNERIIHFVRFNTMQALLVSIVLVLCQIVLPILTNVSAMDVIVLVLNNTVFLGVLGIFGYSVVQCCRGLYAEIPTLSDAVYMQVR